MTPVTARRPLKYLGGYPPSLLARWPQLAATRERWAPPCPQRHPEAHDVRTDRALYDYVGELKAATCAVPSRWPRWPTTTSCTCCTTRWARTRAVSRVQGNKLKAKREIRIASLFKRRAGAFLRMIVVHELAHLKEREHDKAFYALCTHMEPTTTSSSSTLRLWLTARELEARRQRR
jgi:hypothetical protein